VVTDANGNASFTAAFAKVPVGQFVSATATDPNGDTSEFDQDVTVTSPKPSVIDSRHSVISKKKLENPAGSWNNVGDITSSPFQNKGAFE
jgi:hypothetical protein